MPPNISLRFPGGSVDIRYTYMRPGEIKGPRLIVQSKTLIPASGENFLAKFSNVPVLTGNLFNPDSYEYPVLVVPCEGADIGDVDSHALPVTEEEVFMISDSMRISVLLLVECGDDGCEAILRPIRPPG